MKVLVFHCLDKEELDDLLSAQLCVVGDYLCLRRRSSRCPEFCRLKEKEEKAIPSLDLGDSLLFRGTDEEVADRSARTFAVYNMRPFVEKN